ncbi:integrin alpha [Stieleria sp. JC731]|uniref:beta strand repeat-containing protein n=1 Tax=Pirellulaceae TaxID=2691357 RepID=UPI001E2E9AA1|nr:integrin alpha [Stieleria sp. JC731]MCC9604142.1 integrin alpha [Stieleria sp. JC731]
MSLRKSARPAAERRPQHRRYGFRRSLLECLESRQLLAADSGFAVALPTGDETNFGEVIVTEEGRSLCPAFRSASVGEGELAELETLSTLQSAPAVAGNVDVSASIVQVAGPLDVGDPLTSEITFENAGPGSAENTNLAVTFDAGLTGITWEREVLRTIPATIMTADINGSTGFAVDGDGGSDQSGLPVAGIGDINDDGFDDFAIGAADKLYVVYGTDTGFSSQIDLGSISASEGFFFNGFGTTGGIISAKSAGDVNDDGIPDIILGSPDSSPGGLNSAGEAFIVFGSSTFGSSFDVTTLNGSNGFSIPGTAQDALLGASIDGAGDLNNDGIDDVIVGAPGDFFSSTEGESYVIFGASTFASGSISPASLNGTNGFAIVTSDSGANLGESVAGIGDFNGDTIDDILVSASYDSAGTSNGTSYIIYGGGSYTATFNVGSLGSSTGMEISGSTNPRLGLDADALGDVNGDGLADFVIVDSDDFNSGAYVVYGTNSGSASLNLSTLDGSNGYFVPFSFQVAAGGGGDFNGDGFNDVVFANADFVGGFVVFGTNQNLGASVDPLTLDGTNGFKVETGDFDDAPFVGSFAGDVNGDGFDDVIFGAPFSLPTTGFLGSEGQSFVIYGIGNTLTNGSGEINENFDLQPGDQVIYRVDATIAVGAGSSTTVTAVGTVDANETDDIPSNNTATATTTITPSDSTPPQIIDLIVASSSWSTSMIDTVDGPGAGNGLGLSLPGSEQLTPVPWITGIDKIYVVFSENISTEFAAGNLSLIGTTQADYLTTAGLQFGVDGANTGTITLSQPILGDSILLQIRDSLTDPAGNPLDGEWTNEVSLQSGNATAGGDFNFRFNVLAGDKDGDGFVGIPDIGGVFNELGSSPSDVASARADIDADGFVGIPDIGTVFGQLGAGLPSAPPIPAPLAESEFASAVDMLFQDEDNLSTNLLMETPETLF